MSGWTGDAGFELLATLQGTDRQDAWEQMLDRSILMLHVVDETLTSRPLPEPGPFSLRRYPGVDLDMHGKNMSVTDGR